MKYGATLNLVILIANCFAQDVTILPEIISSDVPSLLPNSSLPPIPSLLPTNSESFDTTSTTQSTPLQPTLPSVATSQQPPVASQSPVPSLPPIWQPTGGPWQLPTGGTWQQSGIQQWQPTSVGPWPPSTGTGGPWSPNSGGPSPTPTAGPWQLPAGWAWLPLNWTQSPTSGQPPTWIQISNSSFVPMFGWPNGLPPPSSSLASPESSSQSSSPSIPSTPQTPPISFLPATIPDSSVTSTPQVPSLPFIPSSSMPSTPQLPSIPSAPQIPIIPPGNLIQSTSYYDLIEEERNIWRPCEINDLFCIRKFFRKHSNCKERNGPVPEPLYRAVSPGYISRVNLTLSREDVYYRGLNGRITEFYVNRDTGNLVLAVEFINLSLESNNTFFKFHRRGQEPIVNRDFFNVYYSSIESTIIIPNINNLQLKRSEVFTYVNDANPRYNFGPSSFLSSDIITERVLAEFQANVPINIQEDHLTSGPFYIASFIQYKICDFGLKIL